MTRSDPRLWYMLPANAEAYDAKTFGVDVSSYRADFMQRIPARMWPCADEPSRILDLGCGGGRDMLAFMQAGYDVTGIDYSLALADKARERGCSVVWSEIEYELARAASIEGLAFQGVWAMASLLWVKDESTLCTLIENVWTILADRGVFFLSVPYSEETIVGYDRGKDISVTLYRYSTWRSMLERAGFWIDCETRSVAESSDKEWLNIWAIKHEELG